MSDDDDHYWDGTYDASIYDELLSNRGETTSFGKQKKVEKLVNYSKEPQVTIKEPKDQKMDLELDENKKEKAKLVRMWLDGVNPSTGRHIKIWGAKWMEIMDQNDWHQHVEPVNLGNSDKYNATFLAFCKKHTPVK